MRSGMRAASQSRARFSEAATQLCCTRSMSGNGRVRRISKRTRGFTCSQNSVMVCSLATFASSALRFIGMGRRIAAFEGQCRAEEGLGQCTGAQTNVKR